MLYLIILYQQGQDAFSWPSHSHYDENRQLLGTEEESSERQSSDEEEDKNIWIITQEQHNYYVTQFKVSTTRVGLFAAVTRSYTSN